MILKEGLQLDCTEWYLYTLNLFNLSIICHSINNNIIYTVYKQGCEPLRYMQ